MNQTVQINFPNNINLAIKREDLLHPHISGNKFRKLKYNVLEAKRQNADSLLTFGGAYSNHIAATAAAGKEYGLKTIGVIRGEELADKIKSNPTLSFAKDCGMEFVFVSREDYRKKTEEEFIGKLREELGDFYLVPEGGTNQLAVKGCEEILTDGDEAFDYIACAVGTGGTISGIINTSKPHQKVLGFPALKADLSFDIAKFAQQDNWALITDYHFGGYAKVNEELVAFINDFYAKTSIPLDPVYTGKAVFGVIDLIERGYFPDGSRVLMIHTGGLQGIAGMNKELLKKGLPTIKT
ncbi:1-aminocyclopropane-1-carboxylate deaminase/D-cysteine desulfhydrase [Flavobacterium alkalisoli]|uniref:1-aminocyclopropane-1-carboxylate deaminase/D-cysteine desulfhydrase n=1 Tax=Flavobacterium alkalisoli TaxID=2602769 RepID=A0A5B9FM57_9FLAO|nr:pyridoxal-phosphate dependent enzyme [Flavobacterium alkalisoli]QEE48134.1 1-aminocyclopropane-1-carboxylate deaminase/D-cysteine desulfhydrase [Flavobacterium alkalisoli]